MLEQPLETDGQLCETDMHDGGRLIRMFLNGALVCTSTAVYGDRMKQNNREWTTISRMTECPENIRVKKGDKLTLEMEYDELAHPP